MSMTPKLLVIEDDEDTADTLKALLEELGYRTFTVAPAKAESAAQQFAPDCVLLHLGHPNNPWLNLVDNIRSVYRDVPFIGLTAWNLDAFAADAERLKLKALFRKPIIDMPALLQALPPVPAAQRAE